jgi:hypothetical protein
MVVATFVPGSLTYWPRISRSPTGRAVATLWILATSPPQIGLLRFPRGAESHRLPSTAQGKQGADACMMQDAGAPAGPNASSPSARFKMPPVGAYLACQQDVRDFAGDLLGATCSVLRTSQTDK